MIRKKMFGILILIIILSFFSSFSKGLRGEEGLVTSSSESGNKEAPPLFTKGYKEEGLASYLGNKFHRKKTASGEVYLKSLKSAAHNIFPFGTVVKVINLQNGKNTTVKINDRGPFKKFRIIDLSYSAAKEIGLLKSGVVKVALEIIEEGKGKPQK